MKIDVRFELGEHRGKKVIFILFKKDQKLIDRVKTLIGVKWSQTKKAWYVLDTDFYREKFGLSAQNPISSETLGAIHTINVPAITRFVETLQLKGYSPNTIRTYKNEFASLLILLGNTSVDYLSAEKLRAYFLYCTNILKLSENTIHSRLNAVKFYFEQVLKQEKVFIEIPRPKKPSQLPKVISMKDIKKLFEVTTNPKHNLMLKLCYGMGLRVSEIIALKITDIDSDRMQVLIESAKGKKDRYVNLPQSILEQLRTYYKQYKPGQYLFEGQYGGQYTTRSAQKVFGDAMEKAKINKTVGIHGLRHSYATHLME
ncbi:MAG: tyrosine-type recombinase/integrase, partial [Leadbetterella sp.]